MVGINRNDVYITLEKGEYDKGTKTAQKNVEVAVVVVNDSGEIRQVSSVHSLYTSLNNALLYSTILVVFKILDKTFHAILNCEHFYY